MISVFKSKTFSYLKMFISSYLGQLNFFSVFRFVSTTSFEIPFLLYLQVGFSGECMFTLPVYTAIKHNTAFFFFYVS